MLQGWDPSWTTRRIDAAGLIDGTGYGLVRPSGVSVVLARQEGDVIVEAIGATRDLDGERFRGVPVIDRRASLLVPGFVNAHTHLDLSAIGPRPHDPSGGFMPWVEMVRRTRPRFGDDIHASVSRGVDLSLAGGVVLVGDIGGAVGGAPSGDAARAICYTPRINATCFVEFFGQGARWHRGVDGAFEIVRCLRKRCGGSGAREIPRVRFGVQPHAPYSVCPSAYEAAMLDECGGGGGGVPVCTHVAESMDEREFVARGAGPFRAMLETLGLWEGETTTAYGHGATPIAYLKQHLGKGMLLVHGNDLQDSDVRLMAEAASRAPISLAYCPRASAYFGAPEAFGPHRWRELLDLGINVALGTDSIINLDTPARMSTWDEMRKLAGKADGVTLLKMATINGVRALGHDAARFVFEAGRPIAGVVALGGTMRLGGNTPREMLETTLRAVAGVELLAIGRA